MDGPTPRAAPTQPPHSAVGQQSFGVADCFVIEFTLIVLMAAFIMYWIRDDSDWRD